MKKLRTFKYSSTVVFLSILSVIDIMSQTIPDGALLAFLAVIVLIKASEIYYEKSLSPIVSSLGGLGMGVLFIIFAMITDGAVGGGDIKLITVLGLLFGFKFAFILSMFTAVLLFISYIILIIIFKFQFFFVPLAPYFLVCFFATVFAYNNWKTKKVKEVEAAEAIEAVE